MSLSHAKVNPPFNPPTLILLLHLLPHFPPITHPNYVRLTFRVCYRPLSVIRSLLRNFNFSPSLQFFARAFKMQYGDEGLPHYAAPPQDGPGSLYEAHRHQGIPNHHSIYQQNHVAVANHVMGSHQHPDTLKRDRDAIFG